MIPEIIEMLALGLLIGLTGALAPGPTLVATINASLKGGWGMGPRVTLGHMAVELLMVVLIVAGISLLIGNYSWLIGGIGGLALVIFGALTVRGARSATLTLSAGAEETVHPVLAGAVTSISNPYFWIWWFTVGSALVIGACRTGGLVLLVAFLAGHWAADLGWFTLVSTSVHRGRFVLAERHYRYVLGFCGLFLIVFGLSYLAGFILQNGG
ncbi:MAG TPA: LysE family transporter [Methanoregulaceae archaeon]|nr:LysE family transporter [Methanoregulaceae archaeon]HPD10302.1 LysE family transporter [Methanoregulaceae archaeon]HRT15468.1 LysE family transporter [Methanoregulaceae archaeon]HRU30941.1 LysE family transporter [Methanoregulaceae archaeon]